MGMVLLEILRAHHLLCLQGFRGLGYSPAFVENMAAVHRQLFSEQETLVLLTNGADVICAACPHLDERGACARGAPETRDDAVLQALGVQAERRDTWRAWLDRLAARLDEATFERVCAGCAWLDLGYCREGLGALRTLRAGDSLLPLDGGGIRWG